jgi:hypothetical protein
MGTVGRRGCRIPHTYLTLAGLRSPRPMSHWLTSLIAVMDAAALHLALAPSRDPKLAARLSLRMGFVALEQIARTMQLPIPDEPDPDGPVSVSFDEFRAVPECCARVSDRKDRRASLAALSWLARQLRHRCPAARSATRRTAGTVNRNATVAINTDPTTPAPPPNWPETRKTARVASR